LQNRDYFLLIFTTPPQIDMSDPECAEKEMMNEDSSFPLLLGGVERAAEAGVIQLLPGLGVLGTAYAFWSIVHGAAMLRINYLDYMQMDFDRADRLMLEAFVRGMGNSP